MQQSAVLQVLLQVQPMSELPADERYRGLRDAWRRIPQREGLAVSIWVLEQCASPAACVLVWEWLHILIWVPQAFYRGNGANVARLVPEVALKFALNDQFRVMFSPADGQPPGIQVVIHNSVLRLSVQSYEASDVQAQLAAGAATGVVKTAVCYPLQLAHTRLAADASRWNQPRLYTGLSTGAPTAKLVAVRSEAACLITYRQTAAGLLHCLLQTVRVEGVAGLYKGFLGSVAGVSPYLAVSRLSPACSIPLAGFVKSEPPGVLHGIREPVAAAAGQQGSQERMVVPALQDCHGRVSLCAGAGAAYLYLQSWEGFCIRTSHAPQAVSYPIDTVRRRMQLNGAPGQAVTYRSYWHVFKSMAVAEGPRSFYRGLGVNCLKTAPGAAIQFLAYDLIRSGLLAMDPAAAL